MFTLILFLACSGTTKTDDTSATTDDSGSGTDSGRGDSDDSDTGTGGACAVLSSGDDWYWKGECPQMRTPCDIVVDGCSLTIDYSADGGMTMGMPYEATIEGDTITFADGDTVTGCVGTIEDADTVSGTCDGGCTFELQRTAG